MKNIRLIVLVMTVALVGILVVQAASVWSMISLNLELFNNNVQTALDHVVAKIEQTEIDETARLYNLPKPSEIGKDFATLVEVEEISSFLRKERDSLRLSQAEGPGEKPSHRFFTNEQRKQWKRGNHEAFMTHFTTYFTHYSVVQDIPLERRLSFRYIDSILHTELELRGITQEYVYVVYSDLKSKVSLSNIEQTNCKEDYSNLANFRYRAQLFPSSRERIGTLYLDFPHYKRSGPVLDVVWKLLGVVVFMVVIIFCFYYTVGVLISQRKLSDMKNDFINNMTHELKTPIATISIATDMIQNLLNTQKFDRIDRFTGIIKEENKRLHAQVEKVLQTALIEKKEFKLNLTTLHVHEILLNAAEKIGLQVEAKGGTVDVVLDAEHDLVEADETHFTNVIHNLLDNANKYSPEAPHISIHTYNRPNKGLVIEIKDKGMGISKEAKKHIFDKFYRVTSGNLHDIKGFGLGLSYVKTIVVAHAGEIQVESELGKGSTFSLFFPFKQV